MVMSIYVDSLILWSKLLRHNVDEAKAFATFRGEADVATDPKPLPLQALDRASGQLLAFGIAAALCKTITVSELKERAFQILHELFDRG